MQSCREGAAVDSHKEYVDKYRPTTACTLRITKPWHRRWEDSCW